MKEKGIIMIKINQKEAEYIRSNGMDYLVHMSSATHKSRAKRYYLTEDKRAMRLLKEYRENSVTSTYC